MLLRHFIWKKLLQLLTGGSLLSRDKDFIVFYRGKDFLPAAVSSAIEERRKFAIPIEKHRTGYSSLVMTRQESEHGMVSSKPEDECDGIANPESNIVFEQMKLRSTETTIERTSNKLQMVCMEKMLMLLANILFNSHLRSERHISQNRHWTRKPGQIIF